MFWLVAGPILASPYWGDDHGDSQLPMILRFRDESFVQWWWDLSGQWTATTGRFFPLNVLHGSAVFYLFDSRASYKLYQFVIVALALITFAFLVAVVTRNRWGGYVAFGVALMTLQMKPWFDPFWQFAGQQSLVNILSCGALALAIVASRRRTRNQAVAVGLTGTLLFAGAILTYESSLFLIAAVPLLLWAEPTTLRRKLGIVTGYALVAGLLLANLLYQRSKAVVTNPGYTVSLEPTAVVTTLRNQMEAAVPLSYRWHTLHAVLPEGAGWPADPIVTIAISAMFIASMTIAATQLLNGRAPRLAPSALAAIVYWLIPSLFVAISLRWQSEVRPGVGYIPVMAGGLAVAWLVTLAVARLSTARKSGGFTLAPWSFRTRNVAVASALGAFAVAGVVGVTASSNREAISEPFIVIDQIRRDAYVQALKNGLYDGIAPDAFIGHRIGEWWNWENAPFSSWYGAPKGLQFVRPEDFPNANCTVNECYYLIEENPRPGLITYRLQRFTG